MPVGGPNASTPNKKHVESLIAQTLTDHPQPLLPITIDPGTVSLSQPPLALPTKHEKRESQRKDQKEIRVGERPNRHGHIVGPAIPGKWAVQWTLPSLFHGQSMMPNGRNRSTLSTQLANRT